MANLKREVGSLRVEVESLKQKLSRLTEENGVEVNEGLQRDLQTIMEEKTKDIREQHPPSSFHKLFWEQQIEASKTKDRRQIRWHPMFIKWCLSLKLLSSASYNALRSSNLLVLPSERTLRDYTHSVKAKAGFQPDLDQHLLREAKFDTIADYQKFVCLIFDEVKIKEDLVYDKHSGEVIGFTNIGDVNEQRLEFEQACESGDRQPKLATHMLTFMVRGRLSDLEFPYASFPCTAISGDQLYFLVWGAVRRLEACGFKVLALTCDGASPNQKFLNMHKSTDQDSPVYKTSNPYSDQKRSLYFFSDPSQLIKTVRNCWANSFGHTRTRQLWINGQHISWQHLVKLYEQHQGKGLLLLKKLKWEHIRLTSYSKMRVDLAAQVLSTTVAEALHYEGNPVTRETERFVHTFDKFFDLMNVRSLRESIRKRKPSLQPYKSAADKHLQWLEKDFLSYLDEWQSSIALSASEMAKMCISKETLQGLRFTVKAFVELTKYLLSQLGVQYFLSEKLSQDPLESFFGRQRMRGGYSDNPSVNTFLHGSNSVRVQGSSALKPLRGNCKRGRDTTTLSVDHAPIPKRRRHKNTHTK